MVSVSWVSKQVARQKDVAQAPIRRGLPLVDKRIDLIVYGAWLNQQEQNRQSDGA